MSGVEKAQDEPSEGRFPAAGLADDGQHLSRLDGEAYAIDCLHCSIAACPEPVAAQCIVLLQVLNLQNWRVDLRPPGKSRRSNVPIGIQSAEAAGFGRWNGEPGSADRTCSLANLRWK